MSKKLLSVGVLLTLIAAVLVGGATVVSADAATCSLVSTLAAAGFIPADKLATAQAAAGCGVSTSAACSSFTRNLTVGSTGADVTALQTKLGVTPATGYFGAITKAAVVAYQTANGIAPAAGYVGPITLAKLNYCAPVTTTTTTTTTTTGGTTSTSLKGGAGDVIVSDTSTDVEDTMKEGEEDVNVLGFKVEADGSDVEITSAKVTLSNEDYTTSSERLTDYVDGVSIFMGSKKIGSVDASDFSRDSGSPDTFSKTISLDNAVVADEDDAKFYVAVTAANSIDSEDMDNANWVVELNTLRFNDATGAILTADLDDVASTTFSFEDISEDDKIDLKTSATDPDAMNISVSDNDTTDDVLVGAFKLDVDNDSNDITLNEMLVKVLVAGNTNSTTTSIDDIIDTLTVKIGSEEFDADVNGTNGDLTSGNGTTTFTLEFDDEEMVIDADQTVEVKIYATFNDADDGKNYSDGTDLTFSVAKADIDAEGEDDVVVGGSNYVSETHSVSVDAVVVDITSAALATYTSRDDSADTYRAKFVFKVTAPEDTDIYLPLDDFAFGTAGTAGIEYTVSGTGEIVTSATLSSTADEGDDGYLVQAGESETFTFSVYLTGDNESRKVSITSIWYEESDTTINGTPEVTTGLDDFETDTEYLAI